MSSRPANIRLNRPDALFTGVPFCNMTRRLIARILFCTVLVACGFGEALACMYGPPYRTVCQAYAQADSVIIGEVKDVQTRGSEQVVSLKVNKIVKGQARRQLVLLQPLSPCDCVFAGKEGQKLLLYLNRNGKTGRYQASAEGMGGPVEREQENLYWLNNLTGTRRRTRISGTVR